MKRVIVTTLAAIIIFIIFLYVRLGMYKNVELVAKEVGPFKTLYLDHVGTYYKVSEKIDKVEAWARANGVECKKTFGEFLDDPKKVSEDRLQSRGGCIIDQMPIGIKPPVEMKVGAIPKREYLTAKFDGAPSVSPYKVYPKAFAWMKENTKSLAGSIFEIYSVISPTEVQTEYLFPIQ